MNSFFIYESVFQSFTVLLAQLGFVFFCVRNWRERCSYKVGDIEHLLKITKLDIVEKFININLMSQQAFESAAFFLKQRKNSKETKTWFNSLTNHLSLWWIFHEQLRVLKTSYFFKHIRRRKIWKFYNKLSWELDNSESDKIF